jgi:hypothetical protein
VTPVAGASGHARIEGRRLVETHELRTRPNTFLHEALRALRPEFFLTGQGELHVYLDAAYVGGLEGLGSLRTDNVVSVRYFGESDPGIARFQRGGSPGPVLSVVTLLGTSGR